MFNQNCIKVLSSKIEKLIFFVPVDHNRRERDWGREIGRMKEKEK